MMIERITYFKKNTKSFKAHKRSIGWNLHFKMKIVWGFTGILIEVYEVFLELMIVLYLILLYFI